MRFASRTRQRALVTALALGHLFVTGQLKVPSRVHLLLKLSIEVGEGVGTGVTVGFDVTLGRFVGGGAVGMCVGIGVGSWLGTSDGLVVGTTETDGATDPDGSNVGERDG